MISFQKKEGNEGLWTTIIVRAGFIVTASGISPRDMFGWMLGNKSAIRVNELAATMIDVALNGGAEETMQDNQAMILRGRVVLGGTKGG